MSETRKHNPPSWSNTNDNTYEGRLRRLEQQATELEERQTALELRVGKLEARQDDLEARAEHTLPPLPDDFWDFDENSSVAPSPAPADAQPAIERDPVDVIGDALAQVDAFRQKRAMDAQPATAAKANGGRLKLTKPQRELLRRIDARDRTTGTHHRLTYFALSASDKRLASKLRAANLIEEKNVENYVALSPTDAGRAALSEASR